MIIRDDIPVGYTYNDNGKELTYKTSDGYWREYSYDDNNKILTYSDAHGFWRKYTRDSNGVVLSYKDSDDNDTNHRNDTIKVLRKYGIDANHI